MSEAEKFDCWAVMELFGHNMIAGKVSEEVIGGQGFIRVDVPAAGEVKEFTKFYGPGAVYAISPTTEKICRHITMKQQPVPINRFELPSASDVQDDETTQEPRYVDEIEDWASGIDEEEEENFWADQDVEL